MSNSSTNAIIPLNVQALRVSYNDNLSNTESFAGRTADFEKLPYGSQTTLTSTYTGKQIDRLLSASPLDSLNPGIHLHWELPDFFRRAVQEEDDGDLVFPHTPNRWLVVRYLRMFENGNYGQVQIKKWVVESDNITDNMDSGKISVPLPYNPPQTIDPAGESAPFKAMGKTFDYDDWSANGGAESYLKDFPDEKGNPFYLTAVGFAGPTFSAFYPECASVFGFYDDFKDIADIYNAINDEGNNSNTPIKFKASYQVIGWISDPINDPLNELPQTINEQYEQLYQDYNEQQLVVPDPDAAYKDLFTQYMAAHFRWIFRDDTINLTFNGDNSSVTLSNIATSTLCNGIIQEVVYDVAQNQEFLTEKLGDSSDLSKQCKVEVSIGNSNIEALSALLSNEMGESTGSTSSPVTEDYEYLLNALQLGILNQVEQSSNGLFELDEALHKHGFSRHSGEMIYAIIKPTTDKDKPTIGAILPSDLAEPLNTLNLALKNYYQGRSKLESLRNQIYMDWFRYINLYANNNNVADSNITDIANFIKGSSGEIKNVQNLSTSIGLLLYNGNDISSNDPQQAPDESLADVAVSAYSALIVALSNPSKDYSELTLNQEVAPGFYTPMEPDIMVQGNQVEPVRRNGNDLQLNCRLDTEIISKVLKNGSASAYNDIANIQTDKLGDLSIPIAQLIQEMYCLTPMLTDKSDLQNAQGGFSPLDQASANPGLFENNRSDEPVKNPIVSLDADTFTFANDQNQAWAPNPVAWQKQEAYPELDLNGPIRMDPFLPIFLTWEMQFTPLKQDANSNYTEDILTSNFNLDADLLDYMIKDAQCFDSGRLKTYSGASSLAQKSSYSLASQIDKYKESYPDDDVIPELEEVEEFYKNLQLIGQATSGFNSEIISLDIIPKLPVTNLVTSKNGGDQTTDKLRTATTNEDKDDWNDGDFNTEAPYSDSTAEFGPLRSGYLKITSLELVDVFGQKMKLTIDNTDVTPAYNLNDPSLPTGQHAYLPPRFQNPIRLWNRWISSSNTTDEEINIDPPTSPIFGWIVPNHLDASLFFYDEDGLPIGSFGIEGQQLQYRTNPANATINTADDLDVDLNGKNQHLSDFMKWVNTGKQLFIDFLNSVSTSEDLITPDNAAAQDPGLAVLVGRPLALTRALIQLESKGEVTPISQLDEAFQAEVDSYTASSSTYSFDERESRNNANIKNVKFPVCIGDYAKPNDGLVGYLVENTAGSQVYKDSKFYSQYGPSSGQNSVTVPENDTITLKLNGEAVYITMLIDPRAPIHIANGILPVESMVVPPQQYEETIRNLAMTFISHPIFKEADSLTIPLPSESGYDWSWIDPGVATKTPLLPQSSSQDAKQDYSPQKIIEGWLELAKKTDS